MDIAQMSMNMSSIKMSSAIGLAVTKKAMEVAEQQGNAITQLMEQSVNPNLGSNVDLKA